MPATAPGVLVLSNIQALYECPVPNPSTVEGVLGAPPLRNPATAEPMQPAGPAGPGVGGQRTRRRLLTSSNTL